MHPLFVPPEALEPSGAVALPPTLEPGLWTVNRVAVFSLLTVTIAVTASATFALAPVIVPCTTLIACGFWHIGRRISTPGGMLLYCLAGGAVAGAINAWLLLFVWLVLLRGDSTGPLGFDTLASVGLVGAGIGIAFGIAYLLPMLTQLSARSLRRTEGIDRCLVNYGLWGMLLLGLGLGLVIAHPDLEQALHDVVFVIAAASFVLHTLMLLVGSVRAARRRAWLARVVQGRVTGWRVCEAQRFPATELEGLQVFSGSLFARPPANRLRVLASGDGSDAYRATPLTPKYWVA